MAESDPLSIDLQHMARALALAARGLGRVEPNPMVGAVVVRDGRAIAEGWHEQFGGPHAEVHALARAGELARGSTLYVTLEPCCHHGKTPPCTDAVIATGVARVVVAMGDPFGEVAGRGLAQLRAAGIRVDVGLMETEARRLNAPFLKRCRAAQPYVIAKWAQTLDGCLALGRDSDADRWISSPESRRWVHTLRSRMDAILVGIGTALADDPLLTVRLDAGETDYGRRPARIVLDARLRLPKESQLLRTAAETPLIVVCDQAADRARADSMARSGAEILRVGCKNGELDLAALLKELGRRGMTNLLVEGGAAVLGSFFRDGLVDRVAAFVAPRRAGDPALPAAPCPVGDATDDDSPDNVAAKIAETLGVLRPSISRLGGDALLEGPLRDW